MGLDNIPNQYPCKRENTAVMVIVKDRAGNPILTDTGTNEMRIDCEATTESGGCPYVREYEKSGLTGGQTYGMFGAPCWYRGKYGNMLLDQIRILDDSFYGNDEEETYKSPSRCNALSSLITDTLKEWNDEEELLVDDTITDLLYAAWWLKFVADFANGSDCWY